MKNRLLLMFLPMLLVFIFTGCGARHGLAFKLSKDVEKCTKVANKYMRTNSFCKLTPDHDLIHVNGRGEASSFTVLAYNYSTAAGLQVAAETTLKKNHKYFAFVYPQEISNIYGSLINTPEEYLKKCDINSGNVFSFNLDPCNIHYRPRVANVVIITYKERPEETLTYDAEEVIKYLKKEDRFDSESSLKEYSL